MNVRFNYEDCGSDKFGHLQYLPTQPAWHNVGSTVGNPGVNYLKQVRVCIDSDPVHESTVDYDGLVNVIAHEIGHVYGLTERYIDYVDPDDEDLELYDCNDNDTSIMDAHNCDGIDESQADTDIARVKSLYSDGSLREFTVVKNSDTSATSSIVSWKDYSWAEEKHRIKYYIHENAAWREFDFRDVFKGIAAHQNILGIHRNDPVFDLSFEFDPEKYSSMDGNERLPNGSAYRFCGAPYFLPFDNEASINMVNNCSDSVWLVIPHGELVTTSPRVRVNNTLTINLSGLVPNDLNEFTVKLSGPISRNDECAEADEYVKGLTSFAITGCSYGKGAVTLQTRRHALTIAEMDIAVVPTIVSGTLQSFLTETATTTIEYGQELEIRATDLIPNDTSSFAITLGNRFVQGQCPATPVDDPWGTRTVPLPDDGTIVVRGCAHGWGFASLSLAYDTERAIRSKGIFVNAAPKILSATRNHNSATLTWQRSEDPQFTSYVVNRVLGDTAYQSNLDDLAPGEPFLDGGLSPSTTYTYYILSIAPDGNAAESNEFDVTTLQQPGSMPTVTRTRVPVVVIPPTRTRTPTPTATATPTHTATATPTQTNTPTSLQAPTITGISRSGRTLTVSYTSSAAGAELVFNLYESSSRNGQYSIADTKTDSRSPVKFTSPDVRRGYYYYVPGKACDSGIQSECILGNSSDVVYVPRSTSGETATATPTRTPEPPTATPTRTPKPTATRTPYPATRTPLNCPDLPNPGQPDVPCENLPAPQDG